MAALLTDDDFMASGVRALAIDTPDNLQRWLAAAQGQIEDRIGPVATHPLLGTPIFDATVAEVHLSITLRLRDQHAGAIPAGRGSTTDETLVPGGYPPVSPRDEALLEPYKLAVTGSTPRFAFPPPPCGDRVSAVRWLD